jgi:hypothetical protein
MAVEIFQMSKFWDKVIKCKHEHLNPNYWEYIYCPTPYCSGHEVHCLDCGVFITKCGCGSNNGMSGWPERRWIRFEKKKRWENERKRSN